MASLKVKEIFSNKGISATLRQSMICNQLRNEGKQIYKLGFGQSPFPVLEQSIKDLQKNAFQKDYLNVQGLEAVREAIADYHNQQNNTNYTRDDIFISPGSKQTLLYTQDVLHNDLLVPTPCWVSHKNQAEILDRHIELIHTTEENRYKPTPEQIKQAVKNTQCENPLLLLNYPNNPTGQTFSEQELKEIAEIDENFMVLSDEIYGNVSFQDHVSISKFLPNRTLVSSGISKWMGAGGWRFGYVIIPEEHEQLKKAMNNFISESYSAVSAPIQFATITAYKNFYTDSVQQYVNGQKRIFIQLQDYICKIFRQAGIKVIDSQGGFYIYPDFGNLREKLLKKGIKTSDDLSNTLLLETGVSSLPSSSFGRDESELCLRMCYVDFDGAVALNAAYDSEIDQAFLNKYCHLTIEGCEKLVDWVNQL